MFRYKFLALCVLTCLALGSSTIKAEAISSNNVELQRNVDVDIRKIDIEHYDGIIGAIIEYLKDFFAQATTNCLEEVAKNCKKCWYNPKKLLKCAKEYFKEHEGECAIPDCLQYETLLMSIPSDDDVRDIGIRQLDIEKYDGIIEAIIEYLKDFFVQATKNCLKEVAKNCKKIWYNPKKLLKCAKEYFKEHEGECAIPGTLEYETLIMSIYAENNAENVELELSKIDIENYDGIIDTIIDYLKDFFQQASINCLKEVAKNCKKIWYNPKKLVKCAKEYFKEHKGECAIPDSLTYENQLMTIDNDTKLVMLTDDSIETRMNPALKEIIEALIKVFRKKALKCIKEAANHCKGHWPYVPDLIDCAGKYFRANKGHCALG